MKARIHAQYRKYQAYSPHVPREKAHLPHRYKGEPIPVELETTPDPIDFDHRPDAHQYYKSQAKLYAVAPQYNFPEEYPDGCLECVHCSGKDGQHDTRSEGWLVDVNPVGVYPVLTKGQLAWLTQLRMKCQHCSKYFNSCDKAVLSKLPKSKRAQIPVALDMVNSDQQMFFVDPAARVDLICSTTGNGGQGYKTWLGVCANIQNWFASYTLASYIEHGKAWWTRVEKRHADFAIEDAKFQEKEASLGLLPEEGQKWDLLRRQELDWQKYHQHEDKIERFDMLQCGVWTPTATTLATAFERCLATICMYICTDVCMYMRAYMYNRR